MARFQKLQIEVPEGHRIFAVTAIVEGKPSLLVGTAPSKDDFLADVAEQTGGEVIHSEDVLEAVEMCNFYWESDGIVDSGRMDVVL